MEFKEVFLKGHPEKDQCLMIIDRFKKFYIKKMVMGFKKWKETFKQLEKELFKSCSNQLRY